MLVNSNALNIPLAAGSVQAVITSPPYFGLRDYGEDGQLGLEPLHDCLGWATGDNCGGCYVCTMRRVFAEVWRVLRDDGTLWLNLGDSYTGSGTFSPPSNKSALRGGIGLYPDEKLTAGLGSAPAVLQSKNLIGIPWRVALALQADGWILRQDIIWHKPNPMPESVKDRCTKAHEYVFLLSKQARYYYDAEAVKEANAGKLPYGDKFNFKQNDDRSQGRHGTNSMFSGGSRQEYIDKYYTNGRNRRSVWTVATRPYSGAHFAVFPPDLVEPMILAGSKPGDLVLDPFAGSGTLGRVAIEHGRRPVLCDLNFGYLAEQATARTSAVQVNMLTAAGIL